jgi:uncharacterized protein YgfB (UPF0149 family)
MLSNASTRPGVSVDKTDDTEDVELHFRKIMEMLQMIRILLVVEITCAWPAAKQQDGFQHCLALRAA